MSYVSYMSYASYKFYELRSYVCRLYELYELCKLHEFFTNRLKSFGITQKITSICLKYNIFSFQKFSINFCECIRMENPSYKKQNIRKNTYAICKRTNCQRIRIAFYN